MSTLFPILLWEPQVATSLKAELLAVRSLSYINQHPVWIQEAAPLCTSHFSFFLIKLYNICFGSLDPASLLNMQQ